MISVKLELDIERPIEQVFDLWADLRNDLRWHPQAQHVEKTSAGPIGPGTTFQSEYQGMGAMTLEVLEYQRPRLVARVGRAKAFDFKSTVTLTPTSSGTHLTFVGEVQPRGLFKLLAPLMNGMMRKQANATMTSFKRALEETAGSERSTLRPQSDAASH